MPSKQYSRSFYWRCLSTRSLGARSGCISAGEEPPRSIAWSSSYNPDYSPARPLARILGAGKNGRLLSLSVCAQEPTLRSASSAGALIVVHTYARANTYTYTYMPTRYM